MASLAVLPPETPHTPSDLLAGLALSPPYAAVGPSSVPNITLFPPSPSRNSSSLVNNSLNPGIGPSQSVLQTEQDPADPAMFHRNLHPNEVRQLSLLLTQHLFPVRGSPKCLMREAIALAEKLHDVGIRWDRRRRVMGMHLRGIWEEGQRGKRGMAGGPGHMDMFIQGSFLSVKEEPHPLDPTPLPLEVHIGHFTALPRLTLQAGLANTLPGASVGPLGSHHQPHPNHADEAFDVPPTAMTEVMDLDSPKTATSVKPGKTKWRNKKKSGLRIMVEA